ncbi:hypothetical protein [Streptomyces sp. NPDC059759]|uniref:hypothetical protein n=1 Tax=Streptomyces sp. NPDC059759 TaxID=3346936 RepID=UPI00366961F2
MGWAEWWFVDVPEWAWHLVESHGGLSIASALALALMALVYVAVTLGALLLACQVVKVVGQSFKRGWDDTNAKSRDG